MKTLSGSFTMMHFTSTKKALQPYLTSVGKEYECEGTFGKKCHSEKLFRKFKCFDCYTIGRLMKNPNQLLNEVTDLGPMEHSAANILNCKVDNCALCGLVRILSANPSCARCLDHNLGLRVFQSMIPGGGLGLWATRTFLANESLGLTYDGDIYSPNGFKEMSIMANWNSRTARRNNYLFENRS